MLDLTGGWPTQRRATSTHERISLRPLPVNRMSGPKPAVPGGAAPTPTGEDEHAVARVVALLDAILSGRCAVATLRPVSVDAGFRQFSRTRHQIVDSRAGAGRLRVSSMNRVGEDRYEAVAALATSGLLAVTVQRIDDVWRLTGCKLLRSPRQRGRTPNLGQERPTTAPRADPQDA